jgi:hypothetical protein
VSVRKIDLKIVTDVHVFSPHKYKIAFLILPVCLYVVSVYIIAFIEPERDSLCGRVVRVSGY